MGGLVGIFQRLRIEAFIGGPAIGLHAHLHLVHAVEPAETEARIDLIAQPEPRREIVEGMSLVAALRQQARQAAHLLAEIGEVVLIGNDAGLKAADGHACQNFKLGIGRRAAIDRRDAGAFGKTGFHELVDR